MEESWLPLSYPSSAPDPNTCMPLQPLTTLVPTPVPSQTPRNNDSEGIGASLTTPHNQCIITTPTHRCATPPPTLLTPPPYNTNHSPTATPLTQYCTACEMKSEGNMVICS